MKRGSTDTARLAGTIMTPEFTQQGPKHDYAGAHVVLDHFGRRYLGTIREVYYDNQRAGAWFCRVIHFCGDPWPFEPSLRSLEILERTYERVVD